MVDAQTTAEEYLSTKFDLTSELTDTDAYDPTETYQAGERVYLDAELYNPASTYSLGVLSLFNGNIYITNIAIVAPEAFNSAHWTLLGPQFQIWYVPFPKPPFVLNQKYSATTQVFWKNNVYTCKIASVLISHEIALQLDYYANIPPPNVFPDDVNNGVKYWGEPVPFSITGGLPSGWVKGDNRQRSLVRHCITIVLFYIHKRISPQNIPHHISNAFMGSSTEGVATRDGYIYPDYCALGWLQAVSLGKKPAVGLVPLQPRSGGRIRWGSKIRNQNGY